jgi:hypothetical protein
VTQRAQQSETRTKAKTGSNKTLDQAVGCNRWLGGRQGFVALIGFLRWLPYFTAFFSPKVGSAP